MAEFIDTHCHIHFPDYGLSPDAVIKDALKKGVSRLICVGCTPEDSRLGVEMAASYRNVWASVGIHPHEAKHYVNNKPARQQLQGLVGQPRVVAVGEIGLDYYYGHSPVSDQKQLFRLQLALAEEHNLPVIFHVRQPASPAKASERAFDDLLAILKDFKGIEGVVHSFTDDIRILNRLLDIGLYVGLNGIMTFTRSKDQLEMAKSVPLDRLLLETDAPFLTPVPFRGTICQPKHVVSTAHFLADLRRESLDELAAATTRNARKLFKI